MNKKVIVIIAIVMVPIVIVGAIFLREWIEENQSYECLEPEEMTFNGQFTPFIGEHRSVG